ncbi:MAG: hypothetical protein IPF88_15415 [Candidatus Microthrix sp.]|nr:hypothetical protein [Candidatus Microthrix sp.]MBK6439917.1 hypothetical protein [Candidatus Microthrix sp.]
MRSPPARDIHAQTAARIFEVEPDKGDDCSALDLKMVSHGIWPTAPEAYGLGQRLSIPTGEAKVILDAYFEVSPTCEPTLESGGQAREKGHTGACSGAARRDPWRSWPRGCGRCARRANARR